MVLYANGHALDGRVVAWTLRDGPRHENTVQFQTEIVVQSRRCMLLNDKGKRFAARCGLPARLGRDGEIALFPVTRKWVNEWVNGCRHIAKLSYRWLRGRRRAPRKGVRMAIQIVKGD